MKKRILPLLCAALLLSGLHGSVCAAAEPEPPADTAREETKAAEEPAYAASLEETESADGTGCIRLSLLLGPGETLRAVLPGQDDLVYENTQTDTYLSVRLELPKAYYRPDAPKSAVYEITPVFTVTAADGTVTTVDAGAFRMTFPEAFFEFTEPGVIPGEEVMCPEGNVLHIEGRTNDHTVTVMANGQKLNVYEGGVVIGDYVLSGDSPEEVVFTASGGGFVPVSKTVTVLPYAFTPEPMELTIEGTAADHKADRSTGVFTLRGRVTPGAGVTASCVNRDVWCGTPHVEEDGTFSVEVAFKYNIYGLFPVHLHAEREGFTAGDLDTYVYRTFADRKAFIKGYQKMRNYYELPTTVDFETILAAPSVYGGYRLTGTVEEVTEYDGLPLVRLSVRTDYAGTPGTVYCINMDPAFSAADKIGVKFHVYCTLNGLYEDGESLFIVAWNVLEVI